MTAPTSRVRVALAHSQRMLADSLATMLQSESTIELIWTGTSSETMLEATLRMQPDVAVLELEMPRLTGLEFARRSKSGAPKTEVLLLGERRGNALSQAAEAAGALAYVPTDGASSVLFEAIRAAAEHRAFSAANRATSPEWKERVGLEALSARELEVLRCLTDGLSSREIAEQLSLSFRTVDGYRASLMDKLFIRTVPGLVKFAIRHRLTTLER